MRDVQKVTELHFEGYHLTRHPNCGHTRGIYPRPVQEQPNPGGEGGSILSSTQNATVSGGGWGLAGSGGGAGGAAISGTYASLTDNGTVYGSV